MVYVYTHHNICGTYIYIYIYIFEKCVFELHQICVRRVTDPQPQDRLNRVYISARCPSAKATNNITKQFMRDS